MFQPVPFINLPFSFAEGFSFVEGSRDGQGMLNDNFALQQLVLVKSQNKFPNWPQISVMKNSKTENDFSSLAGAAFIAFIQQRWGMEKFLEFWNECGKLHLYFMSGIFHKVYNVSLSTAWNDFYEAIPLPEDLELMEELEKNSSKVIKNDTEGAIKNILSTLSDKENKVLTLRFGIGKEKGLTLEEVGQELGVTRERIRQIESKALRKLRNPLRAALLRECLD